MKNTLRSISMLLLVGVLAFGVVTLFATPDAIAKKGGNGGGHGGGGKPPKTQCCDPALQPGVGGNPFCFEGSTCCSDGRWSCNNPDGSPSCEPGDVCPS